jgi:hypothetical protein
MSVIIIELENLLGFHLRHIKDEWTWLLKHRLLELHAVTIHVVMNMNTLYIVDVDAPNGTCTHK